MTVRLYDAMNRVKQTIQYTSTQTPPAGPFGSPPQMGDCVPEVSDCGGGSQGGGGGGAGSSLPTTLVTNVFNGTTGADSVLDSRAVPRRFHYNARGVADREKDDFGSSRKSFFSVAGLVDSTVSRESDAVRYHYDSYGRLASRAYSSKSYLGETSPSGGTATTTSTVNSDSLSYTYNLSGQVLVAKKQAGTYQIVRSYYGDGSLRSKTTVNDGGRDSLHYTYDQVGALIRMVHSKSATEVDSVIYARSATTGDITTQTVYWGAPANVSRVFTFGWDALGRRRSVTYPPAAGGFTVQYRYDLMGVLRRVVSNGSNMFTYVEKTTKVDLTPES